MGCCHLFVACSDAGFCLMGDDLAAKCGYKKNLDAGKYFYGRRVSMQVGERYKYIGKLFEAYTGQECVLLSLRDVVQIRFDDGFEIHTTVGVLRPIAIEIWDFLD